MHKVTDFRVRQFVAYIGDIHTFVKGVPTRCPEFGQVSSNNHQYVFVKFEKDINNLGWEGASAKACRPEDLRFVLIEKIDGGYDLW